jgi:deazaflavin-dependent oxidoreductase (nitroreductase family)
MSSDASEGKEAPDAGPERFQRPHHRGVPRERRQGRRLLRGRHDPPAPHEGSQERSASHEPARLPADGDRYVVIASKGGADTHPDWYFNLLADPNAEIEVGKDERFPVRATVVTGPERDELYARQVERRPDFAKYEDKTTRKIPVIALARVPEGERT